MPPKTPLISLLQIIKSITQIHQIHAQLIINNLNQPKTFMYNTIIKSHTNPKLSLNTYISMKRKGVSCDSYTYRFVFKACGVMRGFVEGREVHGEVVKNGFLSDVFVFNGLVGLYARFEDLGLVRIMFDEFGEGKDSVSWNLMMGGYVRHGEMREAQQMFDEMPVRDIASWSIMIHGYGKKMGDVGRARFLFDSMPCKDLVSWNSIIGSHAKVGELEAARQLFDLMPQRNVISWSIMIDGYANQGNPMEALNLFSQMICEGVIKPDQISVMGAISACAQLGALDQGRWIHTLMKKKKIVLDTVAKTALVDMYMKCGSIDEACWIFNSMSERSIVSWNVMIVGLSMNGFGKKALDYFSMVKNEGLPLDDLIFLGALAASSHAGLVNEGLCIINEMRNHYGIEPKLEHYSCLIDLLGRAGHLDQALETLKSMPMKPNSALWGSLLLACRLHRDVSLAEIVVGKLREINADGCGVYVLLSNIYADAGMWEDAMSVRKLMREEKMKKEAGRSVIAIDGKIEEFVSGEKCCVLSKELELLIHGLSPVSIAQLDLQI